MRGAWEPIALVMTGFVSWGLWVGVASAEPRRFKVDSRGGSRVQFVSDAPLETITGITSKLAGEITLDLSAPADAKAEVYAETDSIRTGVDLRDEHLRADNWLDAKRYPRIRFVLTSVSGGSAIKPHKPQKVKIKGKFTLHGITREIQTTARLRFVPEGKETRAARIEGDMLRVQTSFIVKLEDYKVSVPSIVRLKVANEIRVNVDLRATAH